MTKTLRGSFSHKDPQQVRAAIALALTPPARRPSTPSEPHRVTPAMTLTEAGKILSLLDRAAEREVQPELNRLALQYRVATRSSDAATVNRRLRELAVGTQQFAERCSLPRTER